MKTSVRIGNQTAFSACSVTEPFEFAVDSGFDAFEWFPDKKSTGAGWRADDLSAALRKWIRNTASANDIRLTVHSGVDFRVAGPNALQPLTGDIHFARDIGAVLFVMHLLHADDKRSLVESILSLVFALKQDCIMLAVENAPETTPEDVNGFFDFVADRGIDGVGMCFDIGHANL
ncbi:MAG: TIM barrel protein, partial [Nitrospirota bacterium]